MDAPKLSQHSRILVIQTAYLGDVVLMTGILESIHKAYPNIHLDVLVKKSNADLFDQHPYVQHVMTLHKEHGKFRSLKECLYQIRRYRYHLVINIQRFFSSGILTAFSGASYTIGFHKNPLSFLFTQSVNHYINGRHETERNFDLLSRMPQVSYAKPRLYPQKKHREKVKEWKDYICIAPASVWFTKQFPAERWAALINTLPTEMQVILVGGPADRALCTSLKAACTHPKVFNQAGQYSYLETAALFERAQVCLVNDSAPLHIASAVNAPVIAVFCSTVPEFGFGPLSDQSIIISHPGDLYCRPCGLHGKKACPEGHFRCAWDIPLQELTQAVYHFL